MNSLFGVNVDLKPLLAKTAEYTHQQTLIIALLQENNQTLQEIKAILENNIWQKPNN